MASKLSAVVGVACALIAGACKKTEGTPAGTGGAAPTPAGSAAPTPAGCPGSAWKEPGGLFCVDASGFTASEIEKHVENPDDPTMRVYFKGAKGDDPDLLFHLTWFPKRNAAEALTIAANMESDYSNNKGEAKGELGSGMGKFFVFARKDDEKSHKLYVVVQGKKHAYQCEGSSYDTPIAPAVLAACKSLTATD